MDAMSAAPRAVSYDEVELPRPAAAAPQRRTPAPARSPRQAIEQNLFRELDVRLERPDGILWCSMRPTGRPCYTHALMGEIATVQAGVRQLFAERRGDEPVPLDYFVFGSRIPGIYNLGGDLGLFIDRIAARDQEAMRHYAHACVERQFDNSRAFESPVVTIALVQGDALGGGFEHALAMDVLIAERSAKLGLPEVLFNLFPGMGAYSFITRKLDRRRAEQLILSGKVYTGAELYELGLVDVLAEDGEGERALRDYVLANRRRVNMQRAVYRARRLVNPVTLEELLGITDIWAETAMNLDARELKIMARLCAAQDRRLDAIRTRLSAV